MHCHLISLLIALTLMVHPTKILAFETSDYQVNSDQWMVKKIPEGNSFLCIKCETEIRISISFGPRDEKITQNLFDDFLVSEEARLKMAESTISGQIPAALQPKIEILENDYGDFFGLRFLAYHAVVYVGEISSRDTTYLGVSKNRIVRVTLNYMEGDMDDVANDQITKFLKSLVFDVSTKGSLLGKYEGVAFTVEKDGLVIFSEKNLYSLKSELSIRKVSENSFEFITQAEMRLKQNTPLKKDMRTDSFILDWTDNLTGAMKNLNSKYEKDKSTFSIDGDMLTVRSWVHRNQLWETQTWRKK
jgi:hypothetical protein